MCSVGGVHIQHPMCVKLGSMVFAQHLDIAETYFEEN